METFLEKESALSKIEADVSAIIEKEMQSVDSSLKRFHVSLGPSAIGMSQEEILEYVREVNRSVDKQMAEWAAKPEHEKLAIYLHSTIKALREIQGLGQSHLEEWMEMSEGERKLRSKIFGIAETTLLPINRTETFDPRSK